MSNLKRSLLALAEVSVLLLLYIISRQNYLLFHGITEIFSVCIAFTVFIITLKSSKYLEQSFLLLLGYAYLFIGILDFFHTMSYKGMNVFTDYDFYANQIWIATRYFESIVILLAMVFAHRKERIHSGLVLTIYTLITMTLLYSILWSDIFPVCFIAGYGQTSFKVISEYIVIFLLLLSMVMGYKKRDFFEKDVFRYIMISIGVTALSEAAFTLYTDNYGVSNMVGHLLKVYSFYMIYKAIILTGIQEPYDLIFKELNDTKDQLELQNQQLKEKADYDGLTGLYNHRFIYSRIEDEINRYNRYKEPFTILIIDIDNFKEINDTWGHVLGDRVLESIAKILRGNTRASDVVARYGGDEFIILLLESTREQGVAIAEKIRSQIEEASFAEGIRTTVTIGVAEYTSGSATGFVDMGDKCLYQAKKNGKNRVCGNNDII